MLFNDIASDGIRTPCLPPWPPGKASRPVNISSGSVMGLPGTRPGGRTLRAVSGPTGGPPGFPAVPPRSLADQLGSWVSGLSDRERAVLEHRVARADCTLCDMGARYGVSGERIRQVQATLAMDLSTRLRAGPVAGRVSGMRERLMAAFPVIGPWEEAARRLPELAALIPGTQARVGDLAGFLFPGLHRDGPWIGWRPLAPLRTQTTRIATQSLPAGQRAARLAAQRRTLGLDERQWDAWLEYCGLRRFRGWVVRSRASLAELAEAILAEEGHPLSAAQIAALIPVRPWRVRNRCLGTDARFCRTGPGVFGLAGWGLPAYRGIRAHITEQIIAAGGQARLDDIVTTLSGQYGVSPHSVRRFARGPEFTRAEAMITLTRPGTARRPT